MPRRPRELADRVLEAVRVVIHLRADKITHARALLSDHDAADLSRRLHARGPRTRVVGTVSVLSLVGTTQRCCTYPATRAAQACCGTYRVWDVLHEDEPVRLVAGGRRRRLPEGERLIPGGRCRRAWYAPRTRGDREAGVRGCVGAWTLWLSGALVVTARLARTRMTPSSRRGGGAARARARLLQHPRPCLSAWFARPAGLVRRTAWSAGKNR